MRARVAIQPWNRFEDYADVLEGTLRALGDLGEIIRPGQQVIIKPNITADAPASSGGTTHVELVEALIEQIRPLRPSEIIVAEGTGRFGNRHETAFLHDGWREMAQRQSVELYNLDAGPHVTIQPKGNRCGRTIPVSRLILESDVYVSVPCLKTHLSADYTVAIKNSFALIPQKVRTELHRAYRVEEALADLATIRLPDLIVVDGWDGTEGVAGGMRFDHPAQARLMMAGTDAVAVDVVARGLMDWQRGPTRYLDWAIADGCGVGELEKIEVVAGSIDALRKPYLTAGQELEESMPGLRLHDGRACSGCRVAALSAIWRFERQRLLKPVTLIYGGDMTPPEPEGATLVIGDCAQEFSHLGRYFPGCPPSVPDLIDALVESEAICRRCHERTQAILADYSPEDAPYLRVAAAGQELFTGSQVRRGEWHHELLVGDCMGHYVGVVKERAEQFGMSPKEDVTFLPGCPVAEETIAEAIRRWAEVRP